MYHRSQLLLPTAKLNGKGNSELGKLEGVLKAKFGTIINTIVNRMDIVVRRFKRALCSSMLG